MSEDPTWPVSGPSGYGSGRGPRARPLTVGEILVGALRGIWRNRGATLVLPLAATVLLQVLGAGVGRLLTETQDELEPFPDLSETLPIAGCALVLAVVPSTLYAAPVLAVYRDLLGGRTGFGAAAGAILRRFGSVFVLIVLAVSPGPLLVTLALLILAAAPESRTSPGTASGFATVLAVVLLLAVLPVWFWSAVRFTLALPALLVERIGPVAAWRRAGVLAGRPWNGPFWRAAGVMALSLLIGVVVANVVSLVATLLAGPSTVVAPLVTAVAGAIGWTAAAVPAAGVMALVYVDLGARREHVDAALNRLAAGAPG